jgi:sortase (surface protein transpeptidase)
VIITLRRFRTAKNRRSKTFKQLVLPFYIGPTRQIAIRYKQQRRRGRPAKPSTFAVRRQLLTPLVLIVIGAAGVAFFTGQLYNGHQLEPAKSYGSASAPVKTVAEKALPASEPTHISVPSVGIDSSVMSVGKAADGTIETPPVLDWTTGWYKYSPTPGQTGPAVIVGHVDNYKGISVFWKLRDVKKGDIINVARADGRTVKFKVTGLHQFDQDNFPTQEVYGNLKYPGLRLITCGGSFNKQTASYTQNTVVYAFMVS